MDEIPEIQITDIERNHIEDEEIVEEITKEEIEAGLRRIKTGKASGGDGIDPEILKWLGEEGKV